MPTLTVSVIVPNYNRETLIGETISNLLAQSLPAHEIIVVDDGSSDKSVEVIRSFGDKVKLIQQTNQGPGAARNAGLRMATGEYVQFQDSDDLLSLNKIEAQAKSLEQTGADIVFSPWVKIKIEGRNLTLEDHVLQQKMPPAELSLPCWWLRDWSTVFQSLLFRRSFLNKAGFYRTDLMPSEDTEFFFRMLTDFPRVTFVGNALALYRLHNVNKITQDEGVSRDRRANDWSRCLHLMVERCQSTDLEVDFLTRSIFASGIRKHLHYFQNKPGEMIDELLDYTRRLPDVWLSAIETWLRVREQFRLRVRGSRWMPGYQAGPLTGSQETLIRQLGFERK
jgi:glycosyltransferase involved in cell wall biosynthesis